MYQLILGILWAFLLKVVDRFWSRAVDLAADDALNNIISIKNFTPSFNALLKDLKSLSAKASDVKEQIQNAAELSSRKKGKREVEEWLKEVESIEEEVNDLKTRVKKEGFIANLEDGGNVAKLNERVLKLIGQGRDFGELVLDDRGANEVTFLINGMVGEAFDANLKRIQEALGSGNVWSIGVYGVGGTGKTTLARYVCNWLKQQSQGRGFWVTVPREFCIASLQGKIASLLGLDLSNEDEEGMNAARLHRALSRVNNAVVVLDGVWKNIDIGKVGLSAECCRLIITTRSLTVCHRIGCRLVIHVENLGEDEAWMLFKETLGSEMEVGSQVEEIAKAVVELCDGLPQDIITVTESMRGETSIHGWRNRLEEVKERVMGEDGIRADEV